MSKPSVYIESSFISYLTGRPSRDIIVASRQQISAEWWQNRAKYNMYISPVVLEEVGRGDDSAVKKRIEICKKITLVELNDKMAKLTDFLIAETPFPENALTDAAHIAIATVSKFDYILTWNFKHIANATLKSKMEVIVESKGYKLPTITTPEELHQ